MLFTNSIELKHIVEKVTNNKYNYLYRVKVDGNIDEEKYKKMIKP
jgi:hypothetical protein